MLAIVAILIPSTLAGLRDITIGADTRGYGSLFYQWAAASSTFSQYTARVHYAGDLADYGFHLLYFISSRFFPDYHAGLFFASLLTTSFFYLANERMRNLFNIPVWCGMLIYYFSLYNTSFNAIRQMIAVSMVYYSFTFLLERKYRWYIVWNLIAMQFHMTAVIGFLAFGIFIILGNENNTNKTKLKRVVYLFAPAFLLLINVSNIVTALVNAGIFRANYLKYLPGGEYSQTEGGGFHFTASILPFIFLMVDICLYRYAEKKYKQVIFLDVIVFVTLLFSLTSMISNFTYRITYYLIPLEYATQIINMKCFSRKSQQAWIWGVLGLIFLVWAYDIVWLQSGDTVPYIMMTF